MQGERFQEKDPVRRRGGRNRRAAVHAVAFVPCESLAVAGRGQRKGRPRPPQRPRS